jgi:hypothetical protein
MPRPDFELDDLGAIGDSPAQAAYRAEPAMRSGVTLRLRLDHAP